MDIQVSKHSVERYIERVLEIPIKDKEELHDMTLELGGYISKTICDMIRYNDLSHTVQVDSRTIQETIYVLYRDIAIIINNYKDTGLLVSTIFKVENGYTNDLEEDIELINFTKEQVSKLKDMITPHQFNIEKNEYKEKINRRILQYTDILFQNPVKKGGN